MSAATVNQVDMAAVGRVSRRVNLRAITLMSLESARGDGAAARVHDLVPVLDHEHEVASISNDRMSVDSSFSFNADGPEGRALTFRFRYLLEYQVAGDEPVDMTDAAHFAAANGAYHSWPFVRELLHGLTAKMGYPPFMLPVLTFGRVQTPATARSAPSTATGKTKPPVRHRSSKGAVTHKK